ncbi:MAG TPA: hypothetical protein VKS24_00205 [Bradyrhizobium sp.]|nr:hypothetical protein [Bradyrhizobium sp.]
MAKKASSATAKFLSVSQADIEDHIIAYFVAKFGGTDPASLTAATDLKQRFNYSDPSWAAFAGTLTAMPWMKQIGVRLAQPEMAGATTLGALVALIWKKVPKLVGMAKLSAVTSLPKPKTA